MANNESGFMTECREVAQIFRGLEQVSADGSVNAQDAAESQSRSLILVDELGRGTSHADGASIAWAVSEELLDKDAFVLLVTHFDVLTKLEGAYSNVRSGFLPMRCMYALMRCHCLYLKCY